MRYTCGLPLRYLGAKRILPEDSFVFLKDENLPEDEIFGLKKELLGRKIFREPKTYHFDERIKQRKMFFSKGFKETLKSGTVFQVSFDRQDGKLRYIGVRIPDDENSLVDDICIFQLEEIKGRLTVVLISCWKCPIRRRVSSIKHANLRHLSELSWKQVSKIRNAK